MSTDQGFEIILQEDTVCLHAKGKNLKELFRNALRGLTMFIKPDALAQNRKEKKEKRLIAVEAVDIHSLLIEFLTQVVAQAELHGLAFTNVIFKTLGDNFLEAELFGIAAGEFEKEIKAVSYSAVDIKRNEESGLYETTLVFEI